MKPKCRHIWVVPEPHGLEIDISTCRLCGATHAEFISWRGDDIRPAGGWKAIERRKRRKEAATR